MGRFSSRGDYCFGQTGRLGVIPFGGSLEWWSQGRVISPDWLGDDTIIAPRKIAEPDTWDIGAFTKAGERDFLTGAATRLRVGGGIVADWDSRQNFTRSTDGDLPGALCDVGNDGVVVTGMVENTQLAHYLNGDIVSVMHAEGGFLDPGNTVRRRHSVTVAFDAGLKKWVASDPRFTLIEPAWNRSSILPVLLNGTPWLLETLYRQEGDHETNVLALRQANSRMAYRLGFFAAFNLDVQEIGLATIVVGCSHASGEDERTTLLMQVDTILGRLWDQYPLPSGHQDLPTFDVLAHFTDDEEDDVPDDRPIREMLQELIEKVDAQDAKVLEAFGSIESRLDAQRETIAALDKRQRAERPFEIKTTTKSFFGKELEVVQRGKLAAQ